MSSDGVRISGVHLTVRDMEATLAFYRRLGFSIPEDTIWRSSGAAHHVAVKVPDGTSLEFDSVAMTRSYDVGWQDPVTPGAVVISFAVPSREAVDGLFADLIAAGYKGRLAPIDAFWGARYAIVYDPDGNQVALASPSEQQHQSRPPNL
jgi:uncharacterized glyoxalase superfamily protein PhnB